MLASPTFGIHNFLQDNLHSFHMMSVPDGIQKLLVLVSKRQDMGYRL